MAGNCPLLSIIDPIPTLTSCITKGRTDRGEIGLFPSNYTTARASLDKEIGSLHTAIATMKLQQQPQQHNDPTVVMPPPQDPLPALPTVSSASSESSSIGSRKVSRTMSVNKAQRQTTLKASLTLPTLRDVTPEDWTVDQVVTWLGAMGFHDVATIFRGIVDNGIWGWGAICPANFVYLMTDAFLH